MALVAGVSVTAPGCSVVVRDSVTGRVMRSGTSAVPVAQRPEPEAWWTALQHALAAAGGTADVSALSLVGSGHTIVLLDHRGAVLGPCPMGLQSPRAASHVITTVGTSTLVRRVGHIPSKDTPVALLRWWCQENPTA